MATAESLVEELSEDAGVELKEIIFKFSVLYFPLIKYSYSTPFLTEAKLISPVYKACALVTKYECGLKYPPTHPALLSLTQCLPVLWGLGRFP